MKIRSLKSDILKYFILFATIPLLIGSIVILYEMYNSKFDLLQKRQHDILKLIKNDTNSFIENIEHMGEFLKLRYPKRKNDILGGMLQVQDRISTILLLDNDGILVNYLSKKDNNLFKGYDYSNTAYYKAINTNKEKFWSEIFLSYSDNKPSIAYAFRLNKQRIAVFMIDLTILNEFANKFQDSHGQSIVKIIDGAGRFIANPANPTMVYQRKNIIKSDLYKSFISKGKNLENQIFFFQDSNQKEHIGMFGLIEDPKWIVVIAENYADLLGSFNTYMWIVIFFIFFLIAISIYFSIKLSQSILIPFDEISTNMNAVAHGKYLKKKIKTDYKEFEQLISSFRFMQKKIYKREEELTDFNKKLEEKVNEKTLALQSLNDSLEEKIKIEVEKNLKHEKQILEASKLASMGEMIGNIAHQWRQPLSVISTGATGLHLKKELDMLSDEEFYTICEQIDINAQYLSRTIDDFKNYIKGDRIQVEFDLYDNVESFLHLVESSIKSTHIKIVKNIDKDTYVFGYPNELIQCFINIFNNSKDVLQELSQEDRIFFIDSKSDKENIVITFKDSGGGIPQEIIPKIFEPYFTTKHQSVGTGLGLYMTYNLITSGMHGDIKVSNVSFQYDGQEYKGAQFTITLSF